MDIRAEEISKIIREQIGSYAVDVDVAEVGSIITIGDGIGARSWRREPMAGEMLEFPHGIYDCAEPRRGELGAVLLGEFKEIKEGDLVSGPVALSRCQWGGAACRGQRPRQPIDGKGPIISKQFSPIERLAPGVSIASRSKSRCRPG